MDVPEHLPLADLKKAIKEFKTKDTPKLSSKKAQLMEYAVKVGILKGKAAPVASGSAAPELPESKVVLVKDKKKEEKAELPETLKAPKAKKAAKAAPAPAAPAKKTSPFAAFMAAHKGKGLSMAQLATMYKEKRA
jgi:hypothetical protein